MRMAYEPPPWLAALNTPSIASTATLGIGGGASVQTEDSSGFGNIDVFAGPGSNVTGHVVLAFPSTPPTLFISGDEVFGPLTQSTSGNNVTIAWAAALFPSKVLNPAQKFRIHYEWAVST